MDCLKKSHVFHGYIYTGKQERIYLRAKYIRVVEFPCCKTRRAFEVGISFTCFHVFPSVVPPFLIEQLRVMLESGLTVI